MGKRLTAGDPCRCSRQEQCCKDAIKPPKTWPSYTAAASLPQGCSCLPWPQWGEQGRDNPGSRFGGGRAGPHPAGSELGSWEGSTPPCALGRHFPHLVTHGGVGCRAGRRAGAAGGEVTSRQQRHGKAFGTVPRSGSPFPHNRGRYQRQILRVVPGGTSSPSPPPTPPLSRSGPRQCRREGVGTIA